MKYLFIISLIIATVSSCTFKQDVKFNKNWSGEMSCVIDMSMMNSMLEDDPSLKKENLLEDPATEQKIAQLKKVPGIKKVKIKDDGKGLYTINYSFSDLTALNKSGNVLFAEENSLQDFVYFELKDKQNLYFTIPFSTDPEADDDNAEEDKAMAESFGYELTMTFPKKVKSLVTKGPGILSADKKQISFKSDILSMTKPNFDPGMLITFE